MPPTRTNGKICYIEMLEMPSRDIASSAKFYKKVFGRESANAAMAASRLMIRQAR
jgi:predicted enzyme related to lactoylglutathione lyase